MSVQKLNDYSSNHPNVQQSLKIIKDCLTLANYDFSKFCISFNGGKDCTALLHLLFCTLNDTNQSNQKIKALYIKDPDTFCEIEQFVQLSVEKYDLDLIRIEVSDFKQALIQFKESDVGNSTEYIFMGTRSSDISYKLNTIQKTDEDWPSFYRVNPLLHWSYHEIWSFLRDLQIPYCLLYDHGYTSLGGRSNTFVNPKLKHTTPEGEVIYLPAYSLQDPGAERNGRSK